ncbi:AraC family transcriptional regulator [Pseudoteredinibacter isoporae]|uniref:AraC family transcriptional regulator n=1 Tax=Pseudoteredinibacter isoporae TaxID=570281 RepID=UPI00310C733D
MDSQTNITALHGYLQLIERYGIDAQTLLSECGLDIEQLRSQQGQIFSTQLNRLLTLSAERCGDPCFGLKLAKQQSYHTLGLIGVLMETSPDVRSAVLNGIHFFQLHAEGIRHSLEESERLAIYTFQVTGGIEDAATTIDMAIGISCNIVRTLTRQANAIKTVYLAHANPMPNDAYRQLLGAPVVFNHDSNAIVYERKLLDLPLPNHSELFYMSVLEHVEELFERLPQSTSDKVASTIATRLGNQSCTIEGVAHSLGLSKQQLQYRLIKEEQTFQNILDQQRKAIAKEKLLTSDISVSHLSETLGYSSQTAFGRAFERWYGLRPSAWKKQNKTER